MRDAWDNPRRFEDRSMSGDMKPVEEQRPRALGV